MADSSLTWSLMRILCSNINEILVLR